MLSRVSSQRKARDLRFLSIDHKVQKDYNKVQKRRPCFPRPALAVRIDDCTHTFCLNALCGSVKKKKKTVKKNALWKELSWESEGHSWCGREHSLIWSVCAERERRHQIDGFFSLESNHVLNGGLWPRDWTCYCICSSNRRCDNGVAYRECFCLSG